jgi:isochorismate synthase
MTPVLAQPLDLLQAHYKPSESFAFAAGNELLVTSGRFAELSLPAGEASERGCALQAELAKVFRAAQAAGIEAPIVVGSLPFDPSQATRLIVPERYERMRCAGAGAPVPVAVREALGSRGRGREAYQRAVFELLALFAQGSLQKVVLSRALDLELASEVDLQAILRHLLHAHPTAYRFCVPLADGSSLIGASPELLVRKRGRTVVTNPLAGSVARADCEDEPSALEYLRRSPKNMLEHRLVVDEVRQVLARFCPALTVPAEPSLLPAGALWHLSTVIEGALFDPAVNALALASALHPTPAVCGSPREAALEAIARLEGYDRGLFAGATGWMSASGDGEWAVTIRCGVVRGRSARVYAGAGIVPGSVPEQEWRETAVKLAPMLGTLGLAPLEGVLSER